MLDFTASGIVLSTYIGGYISDVIGRRGILIWCMHATTLLQFITMFITNIWLFNFINLLMGIRYVDSPSPLCVFIKATCRVLFSIPWSAVWVECQEPCTPI